MLTAAIRAHFPSSLARHQAATLEGLHLIERRSRVLARVH